MFEPMDALQAGRLVLLWATLFSDMHVLTDMQSQLGRLLQPKASHQGRMSSLLYERIHVHQAFDLHACVPLDAPQEGAWV